MIPAGRDISSLSLEQLTATLKAMEATEAKRNEASNHEKFNKNREVGNKTIPKMQFPPPNPAFLKLKIAIQEEIGKRK